MDERIIEELKRLPIVKQAVARLSERDRAGRQAAVDELDQLAVEADRVLGPLQAKLATETRRFEKCQREAAEAAAVANETKQAIRSESSRLDRRRDALVAQIENSAPAEIEAAIETLWARLDGDKFDGFASLPDRGEAIHAAIRGLAEMKLDPNVDRKQFAKFAAVAA